MSHLIDPILKNERKEPVQKGTLKPQEHRRHLMEYGAERLLNLREKARHLTLGSKICRGLVRGSMNISNETQMFL